MLFDTSFERQYNNSISMYITTSKLFLLKSYLLSNLIHIIYIEILTKKF